MQRGVGIVDSRDSHAIARRGGEEREREREIKRGRERESHFTGLRDAG